MIVSETSLRLLKQLKTKEISIDELLSECAYWACRDGFDELVPKSYPIRSPRVTDFERLPIKEKDALNWNDIYLKDTEVKEYYETVWKVKQWNVTIKNWLKEILTYIPVGDYSTREKVNKRLAEFEDPMDSVKTLSKEV